MPNSPDQNRRHDDLRPHAATVTMFDDTNLALIPAGAEAVAGYVNGRFANYREVVKQWPHAHHLSIAVTSHVDADCLDVEPGDATNVTAPGWTKRQLDRGLERPVLYTSVSNASALLSALAKAGIMRSKIRLWTAHYTGRQHFCGPGCGFGMRTTADATQWTDRALGRSLDESVCAAGFFGPKPKPDPRDQEGKDSDGGTISEDEWLWREWAYGTERFKDYGPFEGPRPHVRNPAPVDWHVRAIKALVRALEAA